jgi:hypothetical protein
MTKVVDANGNAAGWLKVLGFGFTAWSIMLPVAVWLFDGTVNKQLDKIERWNDSNNLAHTEVLRRLDILEERQGAVLQKNKEQDEHMRSIDERLERLERGRR